MLAQERIIRNTPEGYYEGALIRGNSVSLLTAEFFMENDTLFVESNIKEWTYYPLYRSQVEVNQNVLTFKTYYGTATMVFDSVYTEMIGTVEAASPSAQLHLKKVRRPPGPSLEIKELSFELEDVTLGGKLVLPNGFERPLACAIYVQGRGCRDRNARLERAKVLAQYGIATLTFDKRGAKGTGFDCALTSLDQHTNDLVKVIEQVAAIPEIDEKRLGLIGGSYGGWVAPRAAARSSKKVAFIISVVSPATSIKQQQLDNAVYYTKERLGGDEEIIRQIQAYTLLEYETGNEEETFQKMMLLLEEAERNNWKRILSASDIPSSPSDLKNLWVRRNQYDPAEDLKGFDGPFLSLLGQTDRVVPWRENSRRFEELFREANKENYRIVILPGAPHRLEHGNMVRDLGRIRGLRSNSFYFKFDRVVPGVVDEMVVFLREWGFLP